MMKILLTHFDPFGGDSVNSAACAARLIRAPENAGLTVLELPTKYDESVRLLRERLRQLRPDALVMLGQASGRPTLTVERIGINLDQCATADNAGDLRDGTPVFADGADGYFAALPTQRMIDACQRAGIPAALSPSAGTFVCNHLLYAMLYDRARLGEPRYVGFIHVPATPQQAAGRQIPSMDSSLAAEGIRAMLTALIP